jgi:hypothetical protein
MSKKFMVGVGIAYAYDTSENLLFMSKTLSTSGIEISTSNSEVRAGQGNMLQYVYYHSGAMGLTLTDVQWNLAMLAANVGSSIVTGNNVWTEETVTLTGGAGSVTGTPIVTPDGSSTKYGWVTNNLTGVTEKVAFSTKAFTTTVATTGDVCVRYYNADAASRSVQINGNIIPTVARIVIDTQLASSETDVGFGSIIGKVQCELPRAQFSGASTFDMASDGTSKTELKANALVYDSGSGGCASSGYYAKITEILDSANWYDEVIALAPSDADIDMLTTDSPLTMVVYAIPSSGSAFVCPNADLTFASGTAGTCTIGANTGVITVVGAGSSAISISITSKATVTGAANVTVTAP